MNLEQLQAEVSKWANRNFPNAQPHEPLLGAVEEIGELSHAHLKLEQGIRGTKLEHHNAKIDAVGDIVIFLCHYCDLNRIDFHHAVWTTWLKVSKRDWQLDPEKGGE